MANVSFPILSYITFVPLIGVVILLFLNRERLELLRWVAIVVMVADFVLSLVMFAWFDPSSSTMQLVENHIWVRGWGISYKIGIDGISLFLVLLTTLLGPIVILASWKDITNRVKEFLVCLLILQTGMIGVFVSLDLFLFYVFWEVMLIPMYLLIGVWGNPARKLYAAIKFVLYTMVGSLLMLVAIMSLYVMAGQGGDYTFDLLKLYEFPVPIHAQYWMFLAFFPSSDEAIGFAIKIRSLKEIEPYLTVHSLEYFDTNCLSLLRGLKKEGKVGTGIQFSETTSGAAVQCEFSHHDLRKAIGFIEKPLAEFGSSLDRAVSGVDEQSREELRKYFAKNLSGFSPQKSLFFE